MSPVGRGTASVGVSCLILTGDCCINIGISGAPAAALGPAALCPGHDDDDEADDKDAVAAAGTGLDGLIHADLDDVSVGCDSCRSS